MSLRLSSVLASLLAACSPVFAASAAPLTLPDCLRLSLKASPSVRSAALRIEQARRHVSQAVAGLGPRVDFTAGQALLGYDNAGSRIDNPRYDDNTHAYNLTGSWTVFNDFRDMRALKKSRLDLASGKLEGTRTEQELIQATVQAYFGELRAQRLSGVRRRFSESRREYLDVTEKLYKAGVRSYTDLLNARVQVRQQDLEALRAGHDERSARAALNLLLDRPIDDPLELADVQGVPEPPADFAADLREALQRRPDVQESRLALEKAELGVRGAWGELLPALTIDASANYRFDQPRVSVAPGVQFSVTNPYWQVGAKLSLPVFDGGARWQEVKLARLQVDLVREDYEAARRRAASEVLSARLDLDENRQAWEMSRDELKNARESYSIVRDQYRQGNVSALVVKDAENSLSGFEVSEAQALYGAHLARVELLKAKGLLAPEMFP